MESLVSNAINAKHLPNVYNYKNKLVTELSGLNEKFPINKEHLLSLRNYEMEVFLPQQQKESEDLIALR